MASILSHVFSFKRFSPLEACGVHSSDKTCRKPHEIRLSGDFERQFLKGKNDDN
ncbi:MAG: hypothetical protein HPY74_06575 [Firmicutes bacterium]|nr:hypothetical protein [Bacillota bacterium]